MHVAHLETGALARQAARAERREAPLVGDFRQWIGLIHELRQLRGAEEFAHRGGRGFRVDQVLRHHGVDIDTGHAFLDRALHAEQTDAVLVLHQFADRAYAAVAEMIDVVDIALAVAQVDQRLDDRENVLLAQRAMGVRRIEFETHVHLHPADRGKIVALGIEEQRLEHGLRQLQRRRLAGAHHAVDVEQRVLARHVLVGVQRVADIGTDIDVIDVEQRQLLVTLLVEPLQKLLGDFLAGFGIDFAGLRIDEVFGDVVADQFLIRHAQRFQPLFLELARGAHGELLAGLQHHLAGVGVDEVVDGGIAAEAVGIERHPPAVLCALVVDLLVERRKDGFAVEPEREHQRGHGNLAATIDAREHDVLGIEFDIEPGTAIGDHARGKQQLAGRMGLALVVVEEHAGRAMHLRNDDALGAVDDEGAVHGHERDVAHVDVLLLDVLDRLRTGFFVDIEHDQAQRHLQRCRIGHPALTALVDVIFRRLELVADKFQHRGAGKIRNREYRAEHRLQAFVRPPAGRLVHHQELVIGGLLNLDEVRHLRDFLDVTEELANAFATGERLLRHRGLSLSLPFWGQTFRSAIAVAPGLNFNSFLGLAAWHRG